jgi:catechol 2,3-dioxygenase-like lactoylglutathione lyase family enzyme
MKVSLSRVILFALDVPSLAAFYQQALGLRPLPSEHSPEEWADLGSGGARLALHRVPSPWRDDIDIADPPAVRHGSHHKPVFHVDNLAAACRELDAKGVLRAVAADRADDELVRCDFVDPEGNVFQLTSIGPADGSTPS